MQIIPRAFLDGLEFVHNTGFAQFVNDHAWIWPTGEILHFVGICLLFAGVGVFDLRLLGVARDIPASQMHRLLGCGVLGFGICVATGALFLAGNQFAATTYLNNVAFAWKMSFVFLAGMNVLVFYLMGIHHEIDGLMAGDDASLRAKAVAGTSLFLWIGVIFFGRFLMYV